MPAGHMIPPPPSDISPQGASYEVMAAYLARATGLDYTIAYDWLRSEGSVIPGNPLGLTGGGHFLTFPTWQAGMDAIARTIATLPYYAGIRAAIKSANPSAQRAAIIASPWDKGHYAGGAHFFGGKPAPTAPVPPSSGLLPFLPGSGDVYPIPKDRVADPGACPTGYNRAVVDPQLNGLFGTNYVPIDQLAPGEANACVKSNIGPGSIVGQEVQHATVGALAGVAVNGGLLVVAAALGIMGLRRILG